MPDSRERLTARKVLIQDVLNGNYYKQEGFDPNYVVTPYGLQVSRARFIGTVVDTYINDDESYGAITLDDGTATIRAKFFQDLDMMEDVEEGAVVEVMGKVKQYDGETYITPELIVARGPNSELARALEIRQMRERWREHVQSAKELRDAGKGEEDLIHELQGEGLNAGEVQAIIAYLDMDEAFESGSDAEPAQGQPDPRAASQDEADEDEDEEEEEAPGNGRKAVLNIIDAVDEGEGAEYSDIADEAGIDEEALEDVVNDLLSDGTCYEPRPGRIKRL